jgi:hypothetical protein
MYAFSSKEEGSGALFGPDMVGLLFDRPFHM